MRTTTMRAGGEVSDVLVFEDESDFNDEAWKILEEGDYMIHTETYELHCKLMEWLEEKRTTQPTEKQGETND